MTVSPPLALHQPAAPRTVPTPLRGLAQHLPTRTAKTVAATLGAALVAFTVLANAWLCDDAYIVLRVVDNLVSGYGLRWNIAERVQVFTCPLWTLLLAIPYALTREAYYTTITSCFVLSTIAATLILTRAARTPWATVFAAITMATSKAFVDFSTSGLENPLSHLVLVSFFLLLLRPNPAAPTRATFLISLAASLAILNRFDLALILFPPLACHVLRARSRRAVAAGLVGQTPLALWLVFALVYYGFLLPNTAYAKLAADLSPAQFADRGLLYLADSLRTDPISLSVAALGTVAGVALTARSRNPIPAAAALGIILYLAYTVRIGGDFMSGRFVAAPFVAGLTLLLLAVHAVPWACGLGIAAACVTGLLMPTGPLNVPVGADATAIWRDLNVRRGICDERTFYARNLALAHLAYGFPRPDHPGFRDGRRCRLQHPEGSVFVVHGIGIVGYAAGPGAHFVDHYALADPLLARLPPYYRSIFRPGHLTRLVPRGYVRTLQTGRNQIEDPDLARYYDHLALITRGPLFSRKRWRAILDMQLGRLDHLIHHDRFREPARNRWPDGLPLPWREPVPIPAASDVGPPECTIPVTPHWLPSVGE